MEEYLMIFLYIINLIIYVSLLAKKKRRIRNCSFLLERWLV